MKLSRIYALLTAAALSFSLISCTDNNLERPRQSRYRDKDKEFEIGQSYAPSDDDITDDIEVSDELCDITAIEEEVQLLIDDIAVHDNKGAVESDIQSLLYLYDRIYEAHTNMEIVFYRNYTDKAVEEEYNKFYRAVYVAGDMLSYGFSCGYSSEYKELFEDLVDDEKLELYDEGYDLETARLESEADFDDMSENLSRYYDIESNDDLSDDEKDLECAEILIDILKDYDTEQFYSQYDRDYTGEDIIELSSYVKAELLPTLNDLIDTYISNSYWTDTYLEPKNIGDPFEIIRDYAPRLSIDITDSAETICREKLYTICSNDDAYEGAFTDDLPTQNKARIFIGNIGREYELDAAIHEFGHFHAALHDDTPSYLYKNNLDIAEIQSQGFELLFTQFYDEIYGDSAEAKRFERIIDILDSVVSGFFVGEFEYDLVSRIDEIEPKEVVKLFNDTFAEYDTSYHLYEISHIFESPGYYISYATSALAAFDLFDDVLNDPDRALEQYEKIAKISCNSGEYTFKKALSKCGFSDVLTKDYIYSLSDELKEYSKCFAK